MEFYRDFLVFAFTVCLCIIFGDVIIKWTKDWSYDKKRNIAMLCYFFGLFFLGLYVKLLEY